MNYFVHKSSFVDEGAIIGDNSKIWHFSHIMSNAIIGENCNIGQNVFIADDVTLGKNVKIQNNVSLYKGLICEDDVFIGPSVVFTNVKNPRSKIDRSQAFLQTLIKKGASIGANSTIVCGNIIGEYSFIGAGAVITKNIPAYAVYVGNPAKQMGWISQFGSKLEFDNLGFSKCNDSGMIYKLENNLVIKIS